MRHCIYIDGENFIYKISDVLRKYNKIQHRSELCNINFNFRQMFLSILGIQEDNNVYIKYYGTRTKLNKDTKKLKEITKNIIESQRI